MKRVVLAALLLLAGGAASAQMKIGHINSEAIMQTLPEAIDAQKSLDGFVTQWEGELQKMQADWKEEVRRVRQAQADPHRAGPRRGGKAAARDGPADRRLPHKKFGQNGELFQKQNEVMKPIQNKIFKVLEDIAKEDGYDYIFDRSGEILLLYATEKHDLTAQVLQRMQAFGK